MDSGVKSNTDLIVCEDWDKINAVDRMQAYIVSHIDEEITMQALSKAAGYSLWYSIRIFKELLGKTPFDFIRAVRLTKAAEKLRDTNNSVLTVAMDAGFSSHDGFTRAFKRQFNITPQKYKDERPLAAYFTFTPIKFFYLYVKHRSVDEMEASKVSRTVTTTVVERPTRKLILLRSINATNYFSFCEEVGCEWYGILSSVPEKLDSGALITLPPALVKEGTSNIAGGIEVPYDYAKKLPDKFEIIDLPACKMMYFQGLPFENEQDYSEAISIVFEAISKYKPDAYGYSYAHDAAPHFNFGASTEMGAKMAVPVVSV